MSKGSGIFRNDAARERMQGWYDRMLQRLPPPADRKTLKTRHGDTNVLVYGPQDAPPLLVIHGAMAGAPHALYEMKGLLDRYRIYAPDVVGQSVASAEVRPSFDADGFGGWAIDVVDGLGLAKTNVMAISWGGAVAMQLAMHAPERIDRLALLVPAALCSGSALKAMIEVGWPMLRWKLRPTRKNLEALVSFNLTTLDPLWVEFMGDAFGAVKMDFKAPPLVEPTQLAGFDRPTMVIAAEHDLSFPAEAMMKRAAQVFRNLARTHIIAGSKHCPPFDDEFRGWLATELVAFFEDEAQPVRAAS